MSNVRSIKDNQIPSNPAMAEAFKEAANKSSPDIGGDTLQAESINMTQRTESTTHHYARVMADMTKPQGNETMHQTNGEDVQMFAEVKEVAEPTFTGKHGTIKRQAIAAVAGMAGTVAAYSLLTGDAKRTKSAAIFNLSASAAIMGYGVAKRAITKREDPLNQKKLTWKEAMKIAGTNLVVSTGLCSLGILIVGKTSSSEAE